MNLIKRTFYLGAAAALFLAAIPAYAQLALSYKLEVQSPRVEQPAVVVSPCVGLNWVTSIGACGRELFARIAQNPRGENLAVFEPAPVVGQSDLPDLGRPEAARQFRPAGGRETALANGKAADLLLRVGSKLRPRSGEEGGWEWYRFSDTTYENYLQNNGHKALGVELYVPFQ